MPPPRRTLNRLSTPILPFLLILILTLLQTAIASTFSAPPLFCKCTCGTNSTIIPLDSRPPPLAGVSSTDSGLRLRRGTAGATHTCADCTRSFCLGYNLPFCKAVAKEEDVVTSCFARDALLDRVLVWGFVIVTLGLLGWAGVRGWVWERWGAVGSWGGGRARGAYDELGRG